MQFKRIVFFFISFALFLCITSCTVRIEKVNQLPRQTIQFNEAQISYCCAGRGQQTLVFVHGIGCDCNTWDSLLCLTQNDSLKLIFLDLPGFGESSKPRLDYSLDYMAGAVLAVMDAEGVGQATLVGHSLGATVCRQICLNAPSRVKGFMDIDGVYCFYPTDSITLKQYNEALQDFVGGFCDSTNIADFFSGFVTSLAGPHTPESITQYAMSVMPKSLSYVCCPLMNDLVDRSHWTGATINCPVTVICTQNSGLEPNNHELIQALYPQLDYTELTTCGHFIHMEQWQLVYGKILELLKR